MSPLCDRATGLGERLRWLLLRRLEAWLFSTLWSCVAVRCVPSPSGSGLGYITTEPRVGGAFLGSECRQTTVGWSGVSNLPQKGAVDLSERHRSILSEYPRRLHLSFHPFLSIWVWASWEWHFMSLVVKIEGFHCLRRRTVFEYRYFWLGFWTFVLCSRTVVALRHGSVICGFFLWNLL